MKKRGTLMFHLLLISLLPIILLGLVLTYVSTITLRDVMQMRTEDTLHHTAVSLVNTYDLMYEGDYARDDNGNIIKGENILSNDFKAIDNIKNNSNLEASFFFGDSRELTTLLDSNGDRLIGTKAPDKVVQAVIKEGKPYFDTRITIDGIEYYGYYHPLTNGDNSVVGMIFVGTQSEEIRQIIVNMATVLAAIAIVMVLICGTVAFVSIKRITSFIKKTMLFLEQVSEGNLAVTIDERISKRNDEIGMMGEATIKMQESFKNIISHIQNSVHALSNSANNLDEVAIQSNTTIDEVSRAIEDISSGAMSQADETQSAYNNIQKIGEQISQIVSDVEILNTNAGMMRNAEKEADRIIIDLDHSNDKTIKAVDRIAKQTNITNDSAQEIKKAIDIITSIASETNLLSLNASIEAARAGEAGRGFAVVAAQIQKLAEQSNNSAESIKDTINELLRESKMTVDIMEEVKSNVSEQHHNLNKTKDKFNEVRRGIEISMKSIEEIMGRTESLNDSRKSIIEAIQNLSAISEENAASTEETTASTEELNAMITNLATYANELKVLSDRLAKEVSIFKLNKREMS